MIRLERAVTGRRKCSSGMMDVAWAVFHTMFSLAVGILPMKLIDAMRLQIGTQLVHGHVAAGACSVQDGTDMWRYQDSTRIECNMTLNKF